MAGHFPPEVGRAMEDEFATLIEKLGYRVLRKRDVKSSIDVIANFHGEPLYSKPTNRCYLLPPLFAPHGITAFSLKRGDFSKSDVEELLKNREKARKFLDDNVLSALEGAIMVTNYTKTESELDSLLSQNIYCWDGRRLIFYAAKARSAFDLAQKGKVREYLIQGTTKASYLLERETGEKAILVNIVVFVDDHDKNLIVSHDHIKNILSYIYQKSLKPIVDSTELDVQASFKIHILGIANKDLAENAYVDYARQAHYHPQVVFSTPVIFQYGAAPWTTLLQL